MISRLERLRDRFGPSGIEAFVVRHPANIRYLSGFTGSSAALLVRGGDALLFTDSRYAIQAGEEVSEAGVEIVSRPPFGEAVRAASGVAALGFESEHVSVHERDSMGTGEAARRMVPLRGLVEALRAVKDPEEVEKIRASVDLTSRAFEAGRAALRAGGCEAEVAAALEAEMRRGGASSPAFESIVASGPRGALPHARATLRRPAPGEPVVMDIGARLDGYASDMTRTLFLEGPGQTGRRAHAAVLEALRRAETEVRDGARAAAADAAARKALLEAGFSDSAYGHGTGHGVGLEVHEEPRIAPGRSEILRAGMVITLEPGVYVRGWGGVRIEDVLVVQEGGCKALTRTPREVVSA